MKQAKTKPARQVMDEAVTEADFQENVRKAALSLGWKLYHSWSAQHSEAGFPDCFLLRGTRSLVLELKKEGENPTPAQREWLAAFNDTHIEAWVVRPSDFEWLLEKLR